MKTGLKLIVGLLAGILIGFLIGAFVVLTFTHTTWSEYIDKYYTIDFSEGLAVFIVALVSMIVSFIVLVPIHELGHLICGLLTGYKFVSFRIFNYTISKINGKLKVKKFAVAGTGGQCLLTPPDLPLEDIPTGWYNFGGIFANLIVLVIALPFFLLDLNPFFAEALGVFVAVDAIMIMLNGIPMMANGVGNDGYNMKLLKKNLLSKQGIVNQLRANALIQNGVPPKDMPDEFFMNMSEIDYSNALEVSIPLMYSSRLVDEMKYEEALTCLELLYSNKKEIMPLYVKEIACELAFLYLRTGHPYKAEELLDRDLKKYIETYHKMMSSKERLRCAIALYLDKDEAKAHEIYENLLKSKDDYLLQGEVLSDLDLMGNMLNLH